MTLSDSYAPNCTVVICTRDRPAELERCLLSIEKCSYPAFDVLITDSAPMRFPAYDIARRFNVRYVKELKPGENVARNRGALESTSEIIAYLDDDATAAPEWLSNLVVEFRDPEVAMVTGRVLPLHVSNQTQERCRQLGMLDFGPRRVMVDRSAPSWMERANFGGIGVGTNMALRRSIFATWSGFDPRLGRGTLMHGNGENHTFFKLIASGYRIVYTPNAIVFHPLPQTMDELRAEYLSDLAAQTAYLAMLLCEESEFRASFLKYAVEAIGGTRRSWRLHGVAADYRRAANLSILRAATAASRGISLYLLTKVFSSRGSSRPLISEQVPI